VGWGVFGVETYKICSKSSEMDVLIRGQNSKKLKFLKIVTLVRSLYGLRVDSVKGTELVTLQS